MLELLVCCNMLSQTCDMFKSQEKREKREREKNQMAY